jgi:ferredoxin
MEQVSRHVKRAECIPGMKLKPGNIRYFFFFVAILLALPIPMRSFSGGLIWTSPYILLNSVLAVKSLVILNLLGIISLVIIFFRNRWICRYMCPLGVVCDWASKAGGDQNTIRLNLNKYLVIFSVLLAIFGTPVLMFLDPFNIFHMSLEVTRTGIHLAGFLKASLLLGIILLNLILPNIWCRSICPLGGLQLLMYDLKNWIWKPAISKKPKVNKRRLIIAGISGMVAGIILSRIPYLLNTKNYRPPGALPEPDLNLICVRCGNCSSVCPTNIIRQSEDTRKIISLLTPVVDFSESYCLPECILCGVVCPSGAITKFTREEKKRQFMASVLIDVDHCWLQQQKDCDLCRFHCFYNAIEIRKSDGNPIALPVLDKVKCVGCAACKIVCPAEAIRMV